MNSHITYRFGQFRIDPARRKFWRGECEVAVQPRVFDTLAYLLQNRDRAVGRDELISGVWGKVEINDNVLSQIVGRARQLVDDSADDQHTIQTAVHFGYVWVAEVEAIEVVPIVNGNGHHHPNDNGKHPTQPWFDGNGIHPAAHPEAPTTATTDGSAITAAPAIAVTPAARHRSPARYALAGLLLLLMLAVAIVVVIRQQPPPALIEGQTAMVLPVTVVGDAEAGWIRLGVMDLIAERLRAAGQVVVPSDNTVALARSLNGAAEASTAQIEALARAAMAGLVMDARAEASGERWRVTLRVVHGRERRLVAQGADDDVLVAARAAADRMAVMLGYPMADSSGAASGEPDLDRVLQQARAAMLSDRFDEARELLTRVETEQPENPRISYQLASIDLQAGRLDEAQTAFESLIRDVPPDIDPVMNARALSALGTLFGRRLDYATAIPHYNEAIRLLERLDSYEARSVLGHALMRRAAMHGFQNNLHAAQADYARARVALEATGDQLALAKLDGNLAILFTQRARYAEAIPHAQRSAERLATFGDTQSELRAHVILAVAHSALLDTSAALAETLRIDELLAQVSNRALIESVEEYEVGILFDSGRLKAAHELLRKMFDRRSRSAEETQTNWPEAILARQALAAGEPALAARNAAAAVKQAWDPATSGIHAYTWLTLLRAQIALKQHDATAETMAMATEWAETVKDPLVAIYMRLLRAEYAASMGDAQSAETHFEQALKQAEARGIPVELLQVAESYTVWLIGQGNLDRASVVAGRVAGWASQHYDAALLQTRLYHALGETTAWRSALGRARTLAGEREIPPDLLSVPVRRVVTVD